MNFKSIKARHCEELNMLNVGFNNTTTKQSPGNDTPSCSGRSRRRKEKKPLFNEVAPRDDKMTLDFLELSKYAKNL